MTAGTPPLQSTRLLDQVRERIGCLHYSLKPEKAYPYWTRFFIRWSAMQPGGMRHPRDMSAHYVQAFLSLMANGRKVSDRASVCAQIEAVIDRKLKVIFHQPFLDQVGLRQGAPGLSGWIRYPRDRGDVKVKVFLRMLTIATILIAAYSDFTGARDQLRHPNSPACRRQHYPPRATTIVITACSR